MENCGKMSQLQADVFGSVAVSVQSAAIGERIDAITALLSHSRHAHTHTHTLPDGGGTND